MATVSVSMIGAKTKFGRLQRSPRSIFLKVDTSKSAGLKIVLAPRVILKGGGLFCIKREDSLRVCMISNAKLRVIRPLVFVPVRPVVQHATKVSRDRFYLTSVLLMILDWKMIYSWLWHVRHLVSDVK